MDKVKRLVEVKDGAIIYPSTGEVVPGLYIEPENMTVEITPTQASRELSTNPTRSLRRPKMETSTTDAVPAWNHGTQEGGADPGAAWEAVAKIQDAVQRIEADSEADTGQ
ncbi:MAG: hypothetical protein IPN02_07650 [Candidatus Microthrix sp.]|uniref:Uncharacterized protein n=1 Tax=Candidatus Neomicrothrix subdominans TaxID=2954438 RepID=A0A936NAL3_9ACTN|nr:hypothetical protein [Candidatus Microthrix subdominans]